MAHDILRRGGRRFNLGRSPFQAIPKEHMSMTRIRATTALVCALVLAALAPAPGSYGYKGRVLDAAGKPVSGAWIEARPASRGALDAADFQAAPPQSMRTGAGGEWSVSGL